MEQTPGVDPAQSLGYLLPWHDAVVRQAESLLKIVRQADLCARLVWILEWSRVPDGRRGQPMSFKCARRQSPVVCVGRQHVWDAFAVLVVVTNAISFSIAIRPTDTLQTVRHRLRRFDEQPVGPICAAVEGGSKIGETGRLEPATTASRNFKFGLHQQPGCGIERGEIERHWVCSPVSF